MEKSILARGEYGKSAVNRFVRNETEYDEMMMKSVENSLKKNHDMV